MRESAKQTEENKVLQEMDHARIYFKTKSDCKYYFLSFAHILTCFFAIIQWLK
jgi:hypothetical protein